MARTIQSPGVEIKEIDLTLRPVTVEGTSVFIAGFSNQGPIDEILQPTSISEFEQIYGTPTNAAERYFYHTVKNVVNSSPARLLVTRLPYGGNKGEGFESWRYSALAYPVKAVQYLPTRYNITSFTVTNAGSGYRPDQFPTITLSDGGVVENAVLSPVMLDDLQGGKSLASVTIVSNGIYQAQPTVDITSSFWVNTLTVSTTTAKGSGYTVAPEIEFIGSAYESASAYAVMELDDSTITKRIASITVTKKGIGYTTPPTFNVKRAASDVTSSIIRDATPTLNTIDVSAQLSIVGTNSTSEVLNKTLSAAQTYFIGKPTHVELSSEEYQSIREGNIDWQNNPVVFSNFGINTLGHSSIIVLNKSQTTSNNKFEGYYVGFADNNNFNPATPFDSIVKVNGIQSSTISIDNYTAVPKARLNFALSATKFGDGSSISEVMENLSEFDLADRSFQDSACLGIFKLRQSVFSPDTIALDYLLSERYVGSFDYHRQIGDKNGGSPRTFNIARLAEDSINIEVLVNPYFSNRFQETWLDDNGIPTKKVRFLTKGLEVPFNGQGFNDTMETYTTRVGAPSSNVVGYASDIGYADALFPLGVYSNTVTVNKTIGSLPQKLDRAFDLVESDELYQIDLALEAGLGTIYVNAIEQSGLSTDTDYQSAGEYVDSVPLKALSGLYTTNSENLEADGLRLRGNYTAISNVFINYAEKVRKDFMVVLDPLRNIFVQGANSKTINAKKLWSPNAGIDPNSNDAGYVTANFSQHIYWPLRHQFGTTNCSYATTYATWAQVLDPQSNRQIWVPFSGFAGSAMANTDSNFQPWFAPAGFTRGVLVGVNDVAIYPKQKQRDQLYKISLNPVPFFPNEGFVIFGQKTLLRKPSAFDRINVRRLFLNLEKATKQTAKFFVFEPNTLFTRTQVVNVLAPIFENAKNTEGVYDYRIVCDERNNTPDVIDNNELKIDIYIQPVRTAEFILVNFYATRTGTNFDELIGG